MEIKITCSSIIAEAYFNLDLNDTFLGTQAQLGIENSSYIVNDVGSYYSTPLGRNFLNTYTAENMTGGLFTRSIIHSSTGVALYSIGGNGATGDLYLTETNFIFPSEMNPFIITILLIASFLSVLGIVGLAIVIRR